MLTDPENKTRSKYVAVYGFPYWFRLIDIKDQPSTGGINLKNSDFYDTQARTKITVEIGERDAY